MTTLGKILAIVNLVLSLFVMALIIFTYVARTNWHAAYDAQEKIAKAAKSDAENAKREVETVNQKTQEITASLKKANDDLARVTAESAARSKAETTRLEEERKNSAAHKANIEQLTAEVSRLNSENKYIKDGMSKRDTELVKKEEQVQSFRDRAVQAEIAAKTEQERNERLLADNERLTKDLSKAQSTGTTGVAGGGKRNPPAEYVEGLIKGLDPSTGNVELSVGSDAGLQKGHTLEAYRTRDARYLGTLTVIDVRPNAAVARPAGRLNGVLQVGDQVSSTIRR